MVQINRLRLSGFKSFVDKTELDIGDGLNGIVGPNGCGKSNLVEALRWVMGENRAKHMRGGEMEDVIFAGTAARPARSIAEVSVLLDNSDGTAPLPFGNTAQIEVTRRIEKDKGSQYLVNGKAVRARDVQMLFADSMTGAHSPALVSQGRVTQLIQAKTTERRQMLEESAGVASLYTRRHEAELRLKAADDNLARLDLVMNELTGRAGALRNQAKQAARYRDLSDTIRRFDALLAWQEWGATRDKLRKEETRFAESDRIVREALTRASELTRKAAEAAEAVEEHRRTDTESRAALQLLRQTAEQMEREAAHRRHEHEDLVRQIAQAEGDLALAHEQRATLEERARAVAADLEKIGTEGDAETPAGLPELEAEYAQAVAAVAACENDVLTYQDRIRSLKSQKDAAEAALARANSEEQRASARLADVEAQFAQASIVGSEEQELLEAQGRLDALKSQRSEAEETLAAAQAAADAARERMNAAREAAAALTQEKSLKSREVKSTADLLSRLTQGFEGSFILSLELPADLATAVAVAAGDAALRATTDAWSESATIFAASEWPEGVTPLQSLITVPASLAAFVSSVGIVADDEAGDTLSRGLARGQMLVTREGRLWRWDGLRVARAAGQEDTESRIMALRASLRDTQSVLEALEPQIASADAAYAAATAERDTLAGAVAPAQAALRDAVSGLQGTERRIETLQKTVNDRVVRRTVLDGQRANAAAAAEEARAALEAARTAANAFADASAQEELAAALASAEASLAERRASRNELASKIEALKAAALQARQMLQSLRNEAARTADQLARIGTHADGLATRIADLGARKTALDPQVADDEAGTARNAILERIMTAEADAAKTSDAFTVADALSKSLHQELKNAEEEGASQREKRAVTQATVQALQTEQTRIAADIEERFSSSPSALENAVMVDWPEGIPAQSKARAERDHLVREREAMGPVNLRADVELQETEGEHARLDAEKTDLAAAIERLREGIGKLNGEARERIVKTFNDVNTHFQDLFKRLFGGGEAYLKLVDSEDPLDAGLEIFAQPPGKSLQSLTLLSGGEQTLTALAMIFAMFLSNPSPVCVLDEVDAPLDDANVDRVCGLLEDMSKRCATRFLVITHHRMTMARMDRLYGVTMAERGISQLVSVNLAAQGDLLAHMKAA